MHIAGDVMICKTKVVMICKPDGLDDIHAEGVIAVLWTMGAPFGRDDLMA